MKKIGLIKTNNFVFEEANKKIFKFSHFIGSMYSACNVKVVRKTFFSYVSIYILKIT